MNKVRRKTARDQVNPDDYWMGFAFWIAASSRNPAHPQGAVVIGTTNNILVQSCDCPPRAMFDGEYFRPAEEAAIQDFRQVNLTGGTIFITHTPSPESVMDIVAADIKRIVYFPTQTIDPVATDVAQRSYVQIQAYKGNLNWMRDHLEVLKSSGVFS
jgi:deoxycytidylate deaminase